MFAQTVSSEYITQCKEQDETTYLNLHDCSKFKSNLSLTNSCRGIQTPIKAHYSRVTFVTEQTTVCKHHDNFSYLHILDLSLFVLYLL